MSHIIKLGFAVIVMGLTLNLYSCTKEESSSKVPVGRFEILEEGKALDRKYDHGTYMILRDRDTEIKYLYIWQGAGNGGPAITRYYEE